MSALHRRLVERRRPSRRQERHLDREEMLLEEHHWLDARRRRMFSMEEQVELCVVCNSLAASGAVCRSCYESNNTESYPVWRNWMEREQAEYQNQYGYSHWNRNWNPVRIQPRVVTPELLLLKRVKACIGWAVHGLVMEFLDGTRAGYVVDVASINDDDAIERRRCTEWVDIEQGDYVQTVHGFHLSRGCFLCHTLNLELASGRTISFASRHDPWKGEPFQYEVPEGSLLHQVSFRIGKCIGLTVAETYMHLPISSPRRVSKLPKTHQDTFQLCQLVAQRIDRTREQAGDKPLGGDLWHTILCDFLACHDLQEFSSSAVGKLKL